MKKFWLFTRNVCSIITDVALFYDAFWQVGQVTANDSDSGANGRVTYSIISQPQPEKFRIERDGRILTTASLDRENDNNYNVIEDYAVSCLRCLLWNFAAAVYAV